METFTLIVTPNVNRTIPPWKRVKNAVAGMFFGYGLTVDHVYDPAGIPLDPRSPDQPADADELGRFSVAELRARIVTLELANYRAEQVAENLKEELTASAARERFMRDRLAKLRKPEVPAKVAT